MKFFRPEYWSGLPFPSSEDLPDPGMKPRSPALQGYALLPELLELVNTRRLTIFMFSIKSSLIKPPHLFSSGSYCLKNFEIKQIWIHLHPQKAIETGHSLPCFIFTTFFNLGTPLQYSCPENPMDGGAWWATVHGVSKSQTQLSDFTFTFHFHALEKEMVTHSSVLAWRIPGTREPGGLLSLGLHRVGHDWSDLAAAAATTTSQGIPVNPRQVLGCPAPELVYVEEFSILGVLLEAAWLPLKWWKARYSLSKTPLQLGS